MAQPSRPLKARDCLRKLAAARNTNIDSDVYREMQNPQVEIKSFEASDLDDLQSLRALAFEPVFRSFRETLGVEIADIALASAEEEQAELLEKLCDPDSPDQVFVAEIDRAIMGFVSMSLDHKNKTGEISLNAVHPDQRGQGIETIGVPFGH